MDLYLQVGYGMQKLCKDLVANWAGGTAILSPRDLKPNQLRSLGSSLQQLDGTVLLDPQFYLPRADHHRLTAHSYWPSNYETAGFASSGLREMMRKLADLNDDLKTDWFIIPGERAETVDQDWLDSQRNYLEEAYRVTKRRPMVTICLSGDVIRSTDQMAMIVESAEQHPAPAYYVVAESPKPDYLSDDPQWLLNVLDLVAALRLSGAKVVVGYSNSQSLVMACAGANAIASGTWLNVRSFGVEKFKQCEEEETRRRAVWYYCPQALSEFKLPYLDIAVRQGLARDLQPSPPTEPGNRLFSYSQPSAMGWGDSDAFGHYLLALHSQARTASRDSFDETVSAHYELLNVAERTLERLHQHQITGQYRDFSEALSANRAALTMFIGTYGPRMRRQWVQLQST